MSLTNIQKGFSILTEIFSILKKENIGLIEVMGLAVLPPRLKSEMAEVEKYLLGQENKIAEYHMGWAKGLKADHPNVTTETVTEIVQQAIGKVFARVLEDSGVFKRDTKGQEAFQRFTATL